MTAQNIPNDLVERAIAMARRLADQSNKTAHISWRDVTEARAIVAELPKPVDPRIAIVEKAMWAIHNNYQAKAAAVVQALDDFAKAEKS